MTSIKSSGWLVLIGIIFIILGIFAIAAPYTATFASIFVLGWILLFSGIMQIIYAFTHREKTSHFLGYGLVAIFTLLIGILIILYPLSTALALTLLLGAFFIGTGIFRIFSSITVRFPSWGWVLCSGILAVILGILILAQWPSSALWIIGLFVGIDLLFMGWYVIFTSLILKKANM